MAGDHNPHTQFGQAFVVIEMRVGVGHQHQRHRQAFGDLFKVVEVTDTHHADAVCASLLIRLGAMDNVLHRQHGGVGPGDDRKLRIDPGLQGRLDLAHALFRADEVGGFAPELRGQQGIFNGQRRDASTLQFLDGAHHVQCISVAVVGVGDHRKLRHPADAGGLLDELTQGNQREVRCSQDL